MPVTKSNRDRVNEREQRDVVREDRPRRIPVSGNRDVLTVHNKEDGFVYRWVLDTGNRIERFKQGGYEVAPDNGLLVGDARLGTTNEHGASVTAKGLDGQPLVLMRIKAEWHQEDQDAKESEIKQMEGSIERLGQRGGLDPEGTYGRITVGDKPNY
jgi:hypothetical protein